MATRKIPLRKCTGCNEMKEKRELVRVVKNKDGEVSLDLSGKKPGRGAYICKDIECLKKARKAKRIERALDCQISPQLYDTMEKEIEND
ncbi:MAG: YlxR family protein [Ruminococcus sp.]|nr:YlxR family protein [Ruminococcus sp.]MBQ7134078.1 YlxR family protein [Ruminococcus sp.]